MPFGQILPVINVLTIKKNIILLLLRTGGAVNLIGNIHWVVVPIKILVIDITGQGHQTD